MASAVLRPVVAQATLHRVAQAPKMKRPAFHCAPKTGWINDPNAPILVKDTYHLFYQHVPQSSEWQWGLVWGHAKSKDLVQWEHLPVALSPTPGGLDRDGCFSGCATLDLDGRPSLLFTGVIRKAPHEMQPGESHQHEAQMMAVAADPDDPDLREWHKLPGSFLPSPPAEMNLSGWRDPFVLQRPCSVTGNPWWYVMVGAGVRESCGTALVYRSRDLKSGWGCVGRLCESDASTMWECPILAHLSNTHPSQHACIQHNTGDGNGFASAAPALKQLHMLCVSPDYCVNVPRYWLGHYQDGRFVPDEAGPAVPMLLDLGDILYAPNVITDKHGRTVLWAWMQEKRSRPGGTYNSACCLCVPRVLYLSPDGSSLLQQPLPELGLLREQQGAWHAGEAAGPAAPALQLPADASLQLGGSGGSHLDLELVVARGTAESVVLLLQPFEGSPEGSAGAGIAYCWATNTLQVIHSTDLATLAQCASEPVQPRAIKKLPAEQHEDAERAAAAAAPSTASQPGRCGGSLRGGSGSAGQAPADVIQLRILVDGSCVEVFTGTGEALGTRVYRGDEPPLQHCSSLAAAAAVEKAAAGEAQAASGSLVGWLEQGSAGAGGGARGGGLQLVAFGGCAQLLSASVYEMRDMWLQPQGVTAAAAVAGQVGVAATAGVAAAAAAEVLQGLVAAEVAAVTAAAAAMPIVLTETVSAGPSTAGVERPGPPVSPSGLAAVAV